VVTCDGVSGIGSVEVEVEAEAVGEAIQKGIAADDANYTCPPHLAEYDIVRCIFFV
jgi:hypothetical protein